MKTKKTLDYLESGENNALNSLILKVKKITQLNLAVKEKLSSPLCDHCRVANLRGSRLVLQADSPVWGSKLRFELSQLLTVLRQEPLFAGLGGIDFFVAPFSSPFHQETSSSEVRKVQPISSKNRKLLEETADRVTDPRLQTVLRAIASRE